MLHPNSRLLGYFRRVLSLKGSTFSASRRSLGSLRSTVDSGHVGTASHEQNKRERSGVAEVHQPIHSRLG